MSLDISSLRNMIVQDTNALEELQQLLAQERAQLEARKQDELPLITERKAALVEQLNISAQMRKQVLAGLGKPNNAKAWGELLLNNNATQSLYEPWCELVKLFENCQSMNEINGKMIARSQQTLNHLLGLLRGKVAAPSLYNAQGAKTQHTSSYTVAKA